MCFLLLSSQLRKKRAYFEKAKQNTARNRAAKNTFDEMVVRKLTKYKICRHPAGENSISTICQSYGIMEKICSKGVFLNMEQRSRGKMPLSVGLLAHVDAGKTTLSEALLYRSGARRTLGRVDHADSYLDTHNLERSRGITIFSKQALLETPTVPSRW